LCFRVESVTVTRMDDTGTRISTDLVRINTDFFGGSLHGKFVYYLFFVVSASSSLRLNSVDNAFRVIREDPSALLPFRVNGPRNFVPSASVQSVFHNRCRRRGRFRRQPAPNTHNPPSSNHPCHHDCATLQGGFARHNEARDSSTPCSL